MIIEKDIAQVALTTALTMAYTVPAATRLMIKDFDLCNTTAGALTATVHFVRPTATASADNMIVPGVTLDAKSMLQWTGLAVLPAGTTIQVVASATGVTLNMSGAEST